MKSWFYKTLCAYPIGWLLHHANQCPPYWLRTEFYSLKEWVCVRFGLWERAELQHIVKECWDCDSRSVVVRGCRSCLTRGKRPGIYDEFWVRLERWTVGKYAFHKPTLRYWSKPEWAGVEIEGYIRHDKNRRWVSMECFLWLALLFDRHSFRRAMRNCSADGWLPLSVIHHFYRACQVDRWYWRKRKLQRLYSQWQERRALILPRFVADDEGSGIPF